MFVTQLKCMLVLLLFAIIAIGPVSLTCLIGMWIVLARPAWFLGILNLLYQNSPIRNLMATSKLHLLRTGIKCFVTLLVLFVVDISPIPLTELLGLFIVVVKPVWFYQVVANIYGHV